VRPKPVKDQTTQSHILNAQITSLHITISNINPRHTAATTLAYPRNHREYPWILGEKQPQLSEGD
jgi:hypothetical protein